MHLTEFGFLMAGVLAVVAGLTAPLRPDMIAAKETSSLVAFLTAVGCTLACAALILAEPWMLQNTPVAAVLALSLMHTAVTAAKWRRERAAAPRAPARDPAPRGEEQLLRKIA